MRYMKCGTQPASASTQTSLSCGWRSNTPLKMNMPMMSWQPRMIDMNALSLGPRVLNVSLRAREDVERQRQLQIDGGLPERRRTSDRRSPRPRVPRHHHAAQAERLDALQIADPVVDRAHRGLADAEQTVRMRRGVLADPAVVGREARVLEVEVRMVAQHHADRRVQDLRGHAVAILIGQPRVRIPAAPMEILEPDAEHRSAPRHAFRPRPRGPSESASRAHR